MTNKKEMIDSVLASIDNAKKNIRTGHAWKMTMENAWMLNLAQDILQTKKKSVSLLAESDNFTEEQVHTYLTGLTVTLKDIETELDTEPFQDMLHYESAARYLYTAMLYCNETLESLAYLQSKVDNREAIVALLGVIGCYDFKADLPRLVEKAEGMKRYYAAVTDFTDDDDIDKLPSECFELADDLCDMHMLSGILRRIA